MGKKKPTVSQLKKKADAIFSQFVRQSAADPHTGLCACVTCGTVKGWKELQCGHYESRGVNSLRFDERNAHPQCYGCNVARKGNYPRYSMWMVRTYGLGILEELSEQAKDLKQFKVWELQEIIDSYQEKLVNLHS